MILHIDFFKSKLHFNIGDCEIVNYHVKFHIYLIIIIFI